MAQKSRQDLKGYFQAGDRPTESQFSDLIDSFLNRLEDDHVVALPDASTTQKGVSERATLAEVEAGTDGTRYVSSEGAKRAVETHAPVKSVNGQTGNVVVESAGGTQIQQILHFVNLFPFVFTQSQPYTIHTVNKESGVDVSIKKSDGGNYDLGDQLNAWEELTVSVNLAGSVQLVGQVNSGVAGTVINVRATSGSAQVPANDFLPVVTGTPYDGQVLTVTEGSWTDMPTGFTYQWKRNGKSILGATSSTYTVGEVDGSYQGGMDGDSFTCVVTASNAQGSGDPATSNAVKGWTPLDLGSKLKSWQSATDHGSIALGNGDAVQSWADRSPNGRDAGQMTMNLQPTMDDTDQQLNFDGGRLVYDSAVNSQEGFCVVSNTAGSNTSEVVCPLLGELASDDPVSYIFLTNATSDYTLSLDGLEFSDDYRGDVSINGHAYDPGDGTGVNIAVSSPSNFVPFPTTPVKNMVAWALSVPQNFNFLGSFNNIDRDFYGVLSISEMIQTDSLTTNQRDRMFGYLAHKYGRTEALPNGHAYKINYPEVVLGIS